MLLVDSGIDLEHLVCCIVVDLEHDTARVDWDAVRTIAGHHTDRDRAVMVLAAAIATEVPHITGEASVAIFQAFSHLATSPRPR